MVETSLGIAFRSERGAYVSDRNLLDGTQCYLYQRIYKRLQLARSILLTATTEQHAPEVDTMYELPVVDLLIGFIRLCFRFIFAILSTILLREITMILRLYESC